MAPELTSRQIVRVPDVAAMPLAKARVILDDAGLANVVVLYRDSYESRDTVVDQRPPRGQMVAAATEVTVWVARRGLIAHLPALYRRSDATGANLVRELCWIFEHMFDSVSANIDGAWRFYDPRTAPPDFLPWLAQWTSFALDADWPEERKRALLGRAVDLYRLRGTRRGLALFLLLFTGLEPRITDGAAPLRGFRIAARDAATGPRIGVDAAVLPPIAAATCFVVAMPVARDAIAPETIDRIHRIIRLEKPAHAHYYLQFADDAPAADRRDYFPIGLAPVAHEDADV
jgi:phage tail-like protein|nr:phage tail protein [Kofleriaceae bacterium]